MNKEQLTNVICEHIEAQFRSDKIDNTGLVQIIAHIGGLLNLQTISAYAKENNLSYNGAKNFRNVVELFGGKFVVDND
ncbi:MAG TPA: hypothetical protein PKA77_17910 [Chitinophagaceae bacterium]|nr:hypothetical protein [Chitinophagaceae bacterium]